MVILSACLAGIRCRYDGGTFDFPALRHLVERGEAVPVCPEQLGGLTTPRIPAEIVGGDGADVLLGRAKVLNKEGTDVTEYFLHGAQEALKLALLHGATQAVLKARSPSCGGCQIYDGTFTNRLCEGKGVTAALFKAAGIEVRDEENFRAPD